MHDLQGLIKRLYYFFFKESCRVNKYIHFSTKRLLLKNVFLLRYISTLAHSQIRRRASVWFIWDAMFKVHEPQVPEIKVLKVRLISCHCAETVNQVGNTAVRNKWRYCQRYVHQTWRACDIDCRHIPTDSHTDKQINQCQPNTALQTGVVGVPRKQKFRNQKKNAYKKFFKTYECKFTKD